MRTTFDSWGKSSVAWFARSSIRVPLSLLLTACSGADASDLFSAPTTISSVSGPSSNAPSKSIDAGAIVDSGGASTPVTSAAVDAGDDAPAPPSGFDSSAPVADASDAAPAPPPGTCPIAGEEPNVIDDGSWPGQNATIVPQCGRSGGWFAINDGASGQVPAANAPFGPFLTDTPPNGAKGYVRTWGTLSLTSTETKAQPHWGAEIGFDLDDDATGNPQPYDLRAASYSGISFWVRIGPGNQVTPLWFDVPNQATSALSDGAYHSYSFPAPSEGVWTKVTVPFTSLVQPSWTPASERYAFDPTTAETIQWNFDSAAAQALDFDVAIGDVELW